MNSIKVFMSIVFSICLYSVQEELVLLLRKLLFHMPILPGHAASALFNNLVSYHTRGIMLD